ncbi:hypothetical protein ACFW2Y_04995 [Streptomyces sp. NPDC058877]|uniref:hypothetical protein n=1 Tax=unclassified Streptomyces TaxID=2593676 RepID=UPI0036A69851
MGAVLILFGLLGGVGLLLVILLMRRSGGRTDSADGLRIEHEARRQARTDRVSYDAFAVHNAMPTASDGYQRRRG